MEKPLDEAAFRVRLNAIQERLEAAQVYFEDGAPLSARASLRLAIAQIQELHTVTDPNEQAMRLEEVRLLDERAAAVARRRG